MELWLGLVVGVGAGVDGGSCGGVVVMDYIYLSQIFDFGIDNERKRMSCWKYYTPPHASYYLVVFASQKDSYS